MDELVCAKCGKKFDGKLFKTPAVEHEGKKYCQNCFFKMGEELRKKEIRRAEEERKREIRERELQRQNEINSIILSTTDTLQGYNITEYIDIDTQEVIIENDMLVKEKNNSMNNISQIDIGVHRYAELLLKSKLKEKAVNLGGNAVIGLRFSNYLSHNFTAGPPNVVSMVRGTVVKIIQIAK